MALVLAVLVGLVALEGDERAPARAQTDLAVIVSRVEALRGLRFDNRPEPVRVSAEQARREGLSDLDRSYPEERRRADETVLKLLGLIELDVDLRDVSASVFGEGVAGYYDPRSKRLAIVDGGGTSGGLGEAVLAHELVHALEDQRFGLAIEEGESDDPALARLALVEGTATLVMQGYMLRHVGFGAALGGLLGGGLDTGPTLPPFLQRQLLFPYVDGMTFAQALYDRGGGTWKLVDLAARVRPPASTEQVLHPEKWIAVEPPLEVPLRVSLGAGWERVAAGVWGEWQTRELLGGDDEAAAGWGGDRYELWRRGDAHVLVMRWAWDTQRDLDEFAAALRASPVARRSGAAVDVTGETVTLVLAPDAELARRVAERS
jgi:hypothetical protein